MFKSPIEYIKEMIQELVHDFANMAFDWLGMFMLAPTDLSKYPKLDFVYDFVFTLASSLSVVFVTWSLISLMFNQIAGTQSKSIPEILSKTVLAFILSASAPWLLDNVLLKLNNMIVKYFLDTGLNTKTLEAFTVLPATAGLAIFFMGLVITVLFVLLGMQFIQRLGEYILLLVTSPIAAHSIITENFDIWSVWWREALSVIFTQSLQVMMLWIIINNFTGTQKLMDYCMAVGLMVGILKGPKYLRQFFYSTGAGKTAIGMAGGASKMAIYKYAASKISK